jgi:hypothetical protein
VVVAALDKIGTALVKVCVKYKMDEERAKSFWEVIRAAIEKLVVLLGKWFTRCPSVI